MIAQRKVTGWMRRSQADSFISRMHLDGHHAPIMRSRRIIRDPVEVEWGRILAALRRDGPLETTHRVSHLIQRPDYPLVYAYKLAKHLLKLRELNCAGSLLKTVRQSGRDHPLIEWLYAKWLWGTKSKSEAIRFLEEKARFWSQSYLYHRLSAMYALTGRDEESERCFRLAVSLAEKELGHKNRRKKNEKKKRGADP